MERYEKYKGSGVEWIGEIPVGWEVKRFKYLFDLITNKIEDELMEDSTLQTQAKVNKLDTFKYAFEELFIDNLIERMDQNQDIFEEILEDQSFGKLLKELMMKKVYTRMNVTSP